jgi:RNA polymerase sigma-70 factor (ECF subfamily)
LILTDVFEHSARETGELLDLSEGNARVILHRARRAMRAYDAARCRPTRELESRTRQQLEALVRCLVQQDVGGITRLLADDVRALTDAAGEYTALHGPLVGRTGVMRLLLSVAGRRSGGASLAPRLVNGLPAVLIEFASSERRQAPCLLLRCELDGAGRIREVHALLGPRKLAALLPAAP